MTIDNIIIEIENILKNLSDFEKNGLDTSSLRLFIKNLKTFKKIRNAQVHNISNELSFTNKLDIIKSFLEDKKIFPTIKEIINFANKELFLNFTDQKESRNTTIRRIINRIEETPFLKEKVKNAVFRIKNLEIDTNKQKLSKKEKEKVDSYSKWAVILSKL